METQKKTIKIDKQKQLKRQVEWKQKKEKILK